ncbi:MAG TPA: DUF5317 family protein [Chloroflexota bacterium]
MLFVSGLTLAVVVGTLAGGKLERLADLRLVWLWIAPVAFVLQLLVVYGPEPFSSQLAIPLIVGSHAALVLVALLNLRVPGMIFAVAGLAMNLAVIVGNGGLMPIAPETIRAAGREAWKVGDGSPGTRVAQSKDIIRAREDTWLEPLADRYWTGLPGRLSAIFSAGDVVLLAGICTLVVRTMTAAAPRGLHLSKGGAT